MLFDNSATMHGFNGDQISSWFRFVNSHVHALHVETGTGWSELQESTKQACLGAILERVQTNYPDRCEPVWYSTCLLALTLMYWCISDGNPGHMSYIYYFLNYTSSFLYLSSSSSANEQLPGCFRPWTFSLNIGLNLFPSDSFVMFKAPSNIFITLHEGRHTWTTWIIANKHFEDFYHIIVFEYIYIIYIYIFYIYHIYIIYIYIYVYVFFAVSYNIHNFIRGNINLTMLLWDLAGTG